MRSQSFRLSWLAAIFSLLACFPSFGRCESVDANIEHKQDVEAGAAANNEKAVEPHEESGSGSGSWSEDESEDPEDLYFYLFDKESVVTEYEAPSNKDAKDEPDFLYHPQPGHIRIVEFYANWCPHCIHLRPHFNSFAKKMKEIAKSSNINLDIYAVSCVPHKPLCIDQDIKGYPRVRLFLEANGGEDRGIDLHPINDLHPFFVLQKISEKTGIDASAALVGFEENEEQGIHDKNNELSASGPGDDSFWIHRTKYDIYCDAFLSFYFAMEHSIFVGRDPPTPEAKQAFEVWINILSEVLPPSWPLRKVIAEIADNIETALDSEANLMSIMDHYPPPRKKWSRSCSRGDPSMGYTCGLWQLFHIATIGVVEWNHNSEGAENSMFYEPADVGQTLRNYIDHFFACEVCRLNFLNEYDSCGHQRCERFTTGIGSVDDWKELPLWLFEVHNGVNSRLLNERAERDNRVPTHQESKAVEWPARKDCPMCWRADGTFDPEAIFSYLQLTYWPDELFSSTRKRDLLAVTGKSTKAYTDENEEGIESWVYSLIGFVLASSLFTVVSWRKQKEIERTGKHKKADGDIFV